jgi:hypothetical protein
VGDSRPRRARPPERAARPPRLEALPRRGAARSAAARLAPADRVNNTHTAYHIAIALLFFVLAGVLALMRAQSRSLATRCSGRSSTTRSSRCTAP